ncbi:hypothetical protein [Sinorhizobium fredii]|uniref:hypothetical protein n=1 Tax=Rhizobium fredii TaxID=380 RepID=UPI0005B554D9|nr:hypothetical protein [Sinorhizobium fredii]
MTEHHCVALGWAFLHKPTREAFRRSTGEDIGPALDRYREWLEENIIGTPDDVADDAEAAA